MHCLGWHGDRLTSIILLSPTIHKNNILESPRVNQALVSPTYKNKMKIALKGKFVLTQKLMFKDLLPRRSPLVQLYIMSDLSYLKLNLVHKRMFTV